MISRRAVTLAAGAFAAAGLTPLRIRAQTPPLRLAGIASDAFGEAYYAQDAGFFKRANLNVEVEPFLTSSVVATAISGGSLDIGIINPVSLATAVSHGIPFVFLCAGGLLDLAINPEATSLCVAPDSPVKNGRDLEGKNVAVPGLSDTNSLATRAWIDQNGGDSTKVHFVELAPSGMGAALRRGTVAAATLFDPILTEEKKLGIRILRPYLYTVYGNRMMAAGFFTTSGWIDVNRELARRFVAAIYATAAWGNTHFRESGEILAKYSKIPLEVVREMTRSPYAESTNPALFQRVLDVAYKYKYLDRAFKAEGLIAKL